MNCFKFVDSKRFNYLENNVPQCSISNLLNICYIFYINEYNCATFLTSNKEDYFFSLTAKASV